MSIFKVDTLTTWDGLKSATVAAIADGLAALANKFDKAGGALAGSINFTGTGRKITGDFSNATVANRVLFQDASSTQGTLVGALPGLTNEPTGYVAYSSTDTANASAGGLTVNGGVNVSLSADRTGSGAFLPISFYTAGAERLRVATDGAVTSVSGAIGYGPGAGGTVTQVGNKGASVTLHKPSGRVTTHNGALTAGASASFVLTNSLINAGDGVVLNYSNAANYDVKAGLCTAGGVTIFIKNTSGSFLSDALTIDFKIIRGSSS